MTIQENALTLAQFTELAQQHDDTQLELIEGRAVMMSPSSRKNTRIAATIIALLHSHATAHKLGEVASSDGGFIIDERTVLSPDAAFTRTDNLPDDDEESIFYPNPPDLAVEVISPSETRPQIHQKTLAYLQAGTALVWNVYPEGQTVDVVTLDEDGHMQTTTLDADTTLTGGEVLPGFSVRVGDVFK